MKRFEFRLHRVLDLRRQQADIHRHRLQTLMASLKQLDIERGALEAKVVEARASVRRPSLTGSDLVSLAQYEAHIRRRCAHIAGQRSDIEKQLEAERSKAREAERKVKLLEKLEAKIRAGWESEANKEIEALSADSYIRSLVVARHPSSSTNRASRSLKGLPQSSSPIQVPRWPQVPGTAAARKRHSE